MALTESFGFEERWLRLLLKTITKTPDIFQPNRLDEAQYILGGLGNRQVLALRDWARGSGLVVEKRNLGYTLTPLGIIISHFDPNLEEDGTFWAIHHGLCMMPEDIWFYSFYSKNFYAGVYTREEIKSRLNEGKSLSKNVIEKKCMTPLLHTFKSTKLGSKLGILITRENNTYERKTPDETNLHAAVFAFMLCDWVCKISRNTIHYNELMNQGGVCRYLAIDDEYKLTMFLQRIQDKYSKHVLWFSRTAGLDSITFAQDIPPRALLRAYYLEHLEGMEPLEALDAGIACEKKANEN